MSPLRNDSTKKEVVAALLCDASFASTPVGNFGGLSIYLFGEESSCMMEPVLVPFDPYLHCDAFWEMGSFLILIVTFGF